MHSNDRLRKSFANHITHLQKTLQSQMNMLNDETLFYLAQPKNGQSINSEDLTKKVIQKGEKVPIHNFLSSFLTPGLAQFAIEQLEGDRELLFDVAVQHFVTDAEYTQFLVQALHVVLDLHQTDTNYFYAMAFVDQYLTVCVELCQLTLELQQARREKAASPQLEATLLQLYTRA